MKYLVSIENRPYHHWQVDLLIESFKLKGMEDDLIVALAEGPGYTHEKYGRNLTAHKHIYRHDNHGRNRSLPGLNKAYSAAALIEHKRISQPFCLIEPDMVLMNPVPVPPDQFTFFPDPFFTDTAAEKLGLNFRETINEAIKNRGLGDENVWLPIGGVMCFNDVPFDFFSRAAKWGEWLNCGRTGYEADECHFAARGGFVMAAVDLYGYATMQSDYRYEAALLENAADRNFAHYRHGLPPIWSKKMYQFDPDVVFRGGGPDPFEVLMENNPTTVTNEIQKVIRSYRGSK